LTLGAGQVFEPFRPFRLLFSAATARACVGVTWADGHVATASEAALRTALEWSINPRVRLGRAALLPGGFANREVFAGGPKGIEWRLPSIVELVGWIGFRRARNAGSQPWLDFAPPRLIFCGNLFKKQQCE
jgi:prepilin-type processing-associated H-X9-DG protein